jgi:hypothetical protein
VRPEQLRRWVEDHRAAEEASQAAHASPPVDPSLSWRQALSLLALLGRSVGWPVAPDEVRRRGEEQAASAWGRLHAAFGDRR